MLDSIGTSRDGMVDEVLDNINAELSNRGTFGGFGVERRQLLICRNVEYGRVCFEGFTKSGKSILRVF